MLKCWPYEMMFRNFLSNGIELLKRKASPILIFVMTAATAGGRRALTGWAVSMETQCSGNGHQAPLSRLDRASGFHL